LVLIECEYHKALFKKRNVLKYFCNPNLNYQCTKYRGLFSKFIFEDTIDVRSKLHLISKEIFRASPDKACGI
jgi:hypothetical protein